MFVLFTPMARSNDSISVLTLPVEACFLDDNFISISRDLSFPSPEDSLKLRRIKKILRSAQSDEEKFKAHLLAAKWYNTTCDPTTSIHHYKECKKYEHSVKNPSILYIYCMNLGKLYSNQGHPKMAKDYFKRCIELATEMGNTAYVQASNMELAVTLFSEDKHEEAKLVFDRVLELSLKESKKQTACFAYFYLGSIDFCAGDTLQFDQNRAHLYQLAKELDVPSCWHMLYILDFKETELRDMPLEKRKSILLRVYESSWELNDLYILQIVSEYLAELYESVGMKDSTIYFFRLKDSLDLIISDAGFYDDVIEIETKAKGKTKTSNQKIWVYLLIIGFILFVGILGFRYFHKRNKNNLLDANETIAKLHSQAEEKDANISQLITWFQATERERMSTEGLSEVSLVTNEKIESFQQSFELQYPGFIALLHERAPKFNKNDINVVLLHVLKVDSIEQSRILGIAASSLRIRRYRMKKKLTNSDQEDIQSFSEKLFAEYLAAR